MALSLDLMTLTDTTAPMTIRPDTGMPPEQHIAMPTQNLGKWSRSDERKLVRPEAYNRHTLVRLFVFGGAFLLTAYGAYEMYQVVSVSRTTVLQYVLLALFSINFSWIALAFTSAVAGFVSLLFRRTPPVIKPETLTTHTAIIMPVYNESTARTFAAVQAIWESVEATGLGRNFDYFILSDSTQADAWIAEERAFLDLRKRFGSGARLYYRHRPKNYSRKAGNIADFVTRWGYAYDHMLVLDADSLMMGESIVHLAAAMEADPDAGIIQTLPLIINRNTLMARVQQYAARVYGPVVATGLSAWMGQDGNYWGHNAIIRVKSFADHAGLPDLRGKPPFGGHIMSHDFVEAALIRRAGWLVYMLPDLPGSYEESPPSLIDLAVRDRRWCQGNLQHSRVLPTKGLKLPSRQHFATGIMSYMASPFWLLQLIVGIALVLQTIYIRPEYFAKDFSLFPVWPTFDPQRALALFGLTMGILLAPKFFGLILMLFNSEGRKACGGTFRLLLSTVIELILSALIAPILMLIQSGSVFHIILGRDTGWQPQRRDDGSIPLRDIVRRHRWHCLLGIIAGISAFLIATSLFLWMSPTILGLVLAIPISWCSGQLGVGLWLKRRGLLMTPEEGAPPPITTRANELQKERIDLDFDDHDAMLAMHGNNELRLCHEAMLPAAQDRKRGQIEPDRAIAEAKIRDADNIDELARWLKAKERMVILNDRNLIAFAMSLGAGPENRTVAAE